MLYIIIMFIVIIIIGIIMNNDIIVVINMVHPCVACRSAAALMRQCECGMCEKGPASK